ncbi:MAG TPA: alanine--tRNA ligase, partial [Nitrospira sp.]|nr:alanine--tRNA ligase [Nitrospira sp.]
MTSMNDIRSAFLGFFKSRGHEVTPSAPLVPQNDPTLLFVNAGMVPFKNVFTGLETRPYLRAATSQKCVRAGGKHNDLENVGYTARHHTFFEMLGNFSFGDYFKHDAIQFAWELLTEHFKLPKDKLWATVYAEDDEAYEIWNKTVGVPAERIVRIGDNKGARYASDNFWQMADTGPCGPCTEIFYDHGDHIPGGPPGGVDADGDRFIEIWNLVFMQYEEGPPGTRVPLPRPSIDTGMGLERIAAVMQGVHDNYDTDLFKKIIAASVDLTGRPAKGDDAPAHRVIADHLRAVTFLMTDGVLPSNEGRGYVLRRILRRAARHGRLLGIVEPFLHELTASVVSQMGDAYTEITRAADTITEATRGEEERFIATLDQGLPILNEMIEKTQAAGQSVLTGGDVFKLYDTYGFPMDLMAEACREQGMTIDEPGFDAAIEEQRTRARKTGGFEQDTARPAVAELAQRIGATQFIGYDRLESDALLRAILKGEQLVKEAREGDEVEVALDTTPFYPEGGGQVGDRGTLSGPEGLVDITETMRPAPMLILHKGTVRQGRIREGERLHLTVNASTRQDAARNHTATHLVHAALRDLLGPHVKQYGSLVGPNRLRFDFAHFRPLSSRDIDEIESTVNEEIRKNEAVSTEVMSIQDAVAKGALAFFGDKYGEQVRVVSVESFSKELCGGTHCRQTGEIGLFRIVSETGVAAGVRRLEAQTGSGAYNQIKTLEAEVRQLSDLLKVGQSEIVARTRKLLTQLKDKERELEDVK